MAWIALISSIFAAIGALSIGLADRKASRWTKVVAVSIAVASIVSVLNAFASERQAAVFERDLRLKNEEIAELNRQIADTITGGDAYCYLMVFPPSETSGLCDLLLVKEGDHPLYDVSIRIEDVGKLMEMVRTDQEAGVLPYKSMTESEARFAAARTIIQVGNIGVGQGMQLGGIKAPEGDQIAYNIFIFARNGSVSQIVRFRRVDRSWKSARRLIVNGKQIREVIDPNFPRESDGSVRW